MSGRIIYATTHERLFAYINAQLIENPDLADESIHERVDRLLTSESPEDLYVLCGLAQLAKKKSSTSCFNAFTRFLQEHAYLLDPFLTQEKNSDPTRQDHFDQFTSFLREAYFKNHTEWDDHIFSIAEKSLFSFAVKILTGKPLNFNDETPASLEDFFSTQIFKRIDDGRIYKNFDSLYETATKFVQQTNLTLKSHSYFSSTVSNKSIIIYFFQNIDTMEDGKPLVIQGYIYIPFTSERLQWNAAKFFFDERNFTNPSLKNVVFMEDIQRASSPFMKTDEGQFAQEAEQFKFRYLNFKERIESFLKNILKKFENQKEKFSGFIDPSCFNELQINLHEVFFVFDEFLRKPHNPPLIEKERAFETLFRLKKLIRDYQNDVEKISINTDVVDDLLRILVYTSPHDTIEPLEIQDLTQKIVTSFKPDFPDSHEMKEVAENIKKVSFDILEKDFFENKGKIREALNSIRFNLVDCNSHHTQPIPFSIAQAIGSLRFIADSISPFRFVSPQDLQKQKVALDQITGPLPKNRASYFAQRHWIQRNLKLKSL